MKNRVFTILVTFTLLVVGLYFFFWGLVKAKAFLAPLSVAALLAMVMLPVANWFEHKGIKRGWAALLTDCIIILFFAVLVGVLAFQVKSFSEDWPRIKKELTSQSQRIQEFISEKTGISVEEQKQKVPGNILGGSSSGSSGTGSSGQPQQQEEGASTGQSKQSGGGSMLATAGSFMMQFFNLLGTFLLVLIYIFFFLLYRKKFRTTILKVVPEQKSEETNKILQNILQVSQSYLFGRFLLILILAVLYSIGLLISGITYAILISVLAAVLSLVPYVGNIIGYALAIAMVLFSGNGSTGIIGVSITFGFAQFVESYILEPYVVGNKVHINPVFTILVVVLGNAVWGVIGMLISIPALGMIKVIFDQVPALQPLGYLFGEEDISDEDDSPDMFDKALNWAKRKFKKG